MNNALSEKITREQIRYFQENGEICVRQVFDQSWIELLKTGLESSMKSPGEFVWTFVDEDDGHHFHNENRRWHEIEAYKQFIFESPVAELIASLMQWKQANLLFDSAFMRTPGTSTRTPWHQDLPYLCVDGEDALCSAWIPLYPVKRESSLECVRGSHRWEKNYYRLNFDPKGSKGHMDSTGDDQAQWDELPDIESDRESYDIAGYEMAPGDCLIIHGKILHGSAGNLDPDLPQAVVTTRLLGDKAYYQPEKPGGIQPDLSHYAEGCGLKAGAPVDSELFPKIWPR